MQKNKYYKVGYHNLTYDVIVEGPTYKDIKIKDKEDLENRIIFYLRKCFSNYKEIFKEPPMIEEGLVFRFLVILITKNEFEIHYEKLAKYGFNILSEAEYFDEEKINVLNLLDRSSSIIIKPSFKEYYKNHRVKVLHIEKILPLIEEEREEILTPEEWLRRELDRIFNQ